MKGPRKAVFGAKERWISKLVFYAQQKNVENPSNCESLVHNMAFKSHKMSLPWK